MFDEVFFLGFGTDTTFAAARLVTIGVRRGALDVAGVAHRDQHLGVGDQVFQLDLVDFVDDLSAAVVAKRFLDVTQFGNDHRLELFLAGQNFFQLSDALPNRFQFLQNFVDGKLGQTMELQFENGVHLHRSKAAADGARSFTFDAAQFVFTTVEFYAFDFFLLAALGDGDRFFREELQQILFGFGPAGRSPDDTDDFVQVVERDLIAGQNVFAFARLAQIETRAAQNHVAAMLQEQPDNFDQAHFARLSADNGQQDHVKRFLHLGVLKKIIENEL